VAPTNRMPHAPHHPVTPGHVPTPSGPPASPIGPGNYPRGSAVVPPPPPRADGGYGYPVAPVAASGEGDGGANRQLLIMLAVVLGVLVLLCAGVISYLYSRESSKADALSVGMVTSVRQIPTGRDAPIGAPYRRGDDRMTEGRLTR